jgi:hypothetical protein
MAEPNYESLGRYHAALEAFNTLSSQRHELLTSLSIQLTRSMSSPADMVVLTLNRAQLEETAKEVIRIDAELMDVVELINRHANECGKPMVKIINTLF